MESLNMNTPTTMDEIVFEKRNKDYGAYLLRKLYDKNVLLSLLLATMVFSVFLLFPLVNTLLAEKKEVPPPPKKKVELAIIDVPLDPKTPPPPPLPPVEPPKIKTVKFVPPEIVPDEKVEEPPPPTQKELEKETASDKDREGEENPDGELPPDVDTGKLGGLGDTESDEPWMGPITKDVEFDGGYKSYIAKNVSDRLRHYVSERGIKGRINFFAIIGKDGSVKSVEVIPGREIPNCKMCTEEILEIIKKMPKWKPAENNGIPVVRKIMIPVAF